MTPIFRFGFPMKLFSVAPKPHRLGYLMLGQLWNDTVVLTKQMLTARNKPAEGISQHDQHAQIAVEFLNLRLLASRLHEGANLFRGMGQFSRDWEKELNPGAVKAAGCIKSYFASKQAPLSLLRNRIGFHQDRSLAEEAIDTISDDELFDYRGQHFANTVFISAEVLSLRSLAILLEMPTTREALDVLATDVLTVIGWTYAACQGYHDWFLARHILPHHPLENGTMLNLSAPSFGDILVPFFADMAEMAETVRERAPR